MHRGGVGQRVGEPPGRAGRGLLQRCCRDVQASLGLNGSSLRALPSTPWLTPGPALPRVVQGQAVPAADGGLLDVHARREGHALRLVHGIAVPLAQRPPSVPALPCR